MNSQLVGLRFKLRDISGKSYLKFYMTWKSLENWKVFPEKVITFPVLDEDRVKANDYEIIKVLIDDVLDAIEEWDLNASFKFYWRDGAKAKMLEQNLILEQI